LIAWRVIFIVFVLVRNSEETGFVYVDGAEVETRAAYRHLFGERIEVLLFGPLIPDFEPIASGWYIGDRDLAVLPADRMIGCIEDDDERFHLWVNIAIDSNNSRSGERNFLTLACL